jgi:hypothetical protein
LTARAPCLGAERCELGSARLRLLPHQRGGGFAGEAAEGRRHEEPAARQVAPVGGPGESAGRAATREQVGERGAVRPEDAGLRVDDQAALGVKEGTGHLGDPIGRVERRIPTEVVLQWPAGDRGRPGGGRVTLAAGNLTALPSRLARRLPRCAARADIVSAGFTAAPA